MNKKRTNIRNKKVIITAIRASNRKYSKEELNVMDERELLKIYDDTVVKGKK